MVHPQLSRTNLLLLCAQSYITNLIAAVWGVVWAAIWPVAAPLKRRMFPSGQPLIEFVLKCAVDGKRKRGHRRMYMYCPGWYYIEWGAWTLEVFPSDWLDGHIRALFRIQYEEPAASD